MLIFTAIILGIIEGFTEFLPISSTGHLIVAAHLLNFQGAFAVLFEIVIQLGAILAVIYYYRRKIFDSLLKLKPGQDGFAFWSKILMAFFPFAVTGFLTKDLIEKYLFSPYTVACALIIGAILILLVGRGQGSGITRIANLSYQSAFLIGVAQCLALFPGMSRSASTIIGGLLLGLTLTEAAEFSFFLAIPTMLAATTVSLIHGVGSLSSQEALALSIGFLISFITALVVIDKFIAFLTKHSMRPFAYYRIVVGILIFIVFAEKLP